MTDNQTPVTDPPEVPPPSEQLPPDEPPVVDEAPVTPDAAPPGDAPDDLGSRLERLGGEPAPDITPEEFARLQQAGQIHIDPRGRVRATRRDETDAGISLRKRRAWYSA